MLKDMRDRLLDHLPRSVRNIEKQINTIQVEIGEQEAKLSASLNSLDRKITNSGYIKLSEREILSKIFTGAKMYLDPLDVGLVPHLILDGDWERNITQAWLSVLTPNDTVADIGANFGYFSVLAAQQTQRSCKVLLFEANPELIQYLEKTMSVNSFDNCSTIINAAVADKEGQLTLNILEDFVASSSIHKLDELNEYGHNAAKLKIAKSVKVPALSLDSYCKQNKIPTLDLIKMDIEGFEDRAYLGMRNIVKASPRITMFIEFTKEGYDNPKKFYEQMLKDFGNIYLIDDDGKIYTPEDTSYSAVIDASADWVMPIFSKRDDLVTIG